MTSSPCHTPLSTCPNSSKPPHIPQLIAETGLNEVVGYSCYTLTAQTAHNADVRYSCYTLVSPLIMLLLDTAFIERPQIEEQSHTG